MGDLWEGEHLDTHRAVAIKFLKPGIDSPEFQRRFFREGHALSAVRHPNVVEVLDVFPFDDRSPAIVMELLSGETLADRLERDKVLAVEEVARIMLPVVSAVGTAHALGFVHRALEPEKFFLPGREDAETVKVLDFGIAKVRERRRDSHSGSGTASGAMLGTPPYMSPEQVYGEEDIDHRTDIWSLGLILYQCLSGVLPTGAANVGQMLEKVLTRATVATRARAPGSARGAHLPRQPDALSEAGCSTG